ncbi:MAG: helix-turn-helix transcriptional regulator [Flavobacteriales bacterium]|nr:helix-turn-helix transcriptional regulator [Flavobacteriales bacterium]MBP6697099.1 helix-turn-helix transcriptional regulator [Flavobacteriales bacterium]
MVHCPYCESTRSLLMGNVFCSRHANADMGALDNGTLFIRTRKLEETAEHISRLSIRLMLNGDQWYKVGSTDRRIDTGNFLVVNQGQRYRTAFSGAEELEMLMVGFRPGQAEDVFRSMTDRGERLLDDPFTAGAPMHFFEQTYPMDPLIHAQFRRLRALMEAPLADRMDADLYHIHTTLLERLIRLQFETVEVADRLPQLKRSTRMEVWRRLNIARDLMEAHFARPLKVPDMAAVAYLSPHHFKRLFTEAFGTTPHRYLVQVRLRRAQELLATGRHSVHDVCMRVGFSDPSSFVRLFKRENGITPGSQLERSPSPGRRAPRFLGRP